MEFLEPSKIFYLTMWTTLSYLTLFPTFGFVPLGFLKEVLMRQDFHGPSGVLISPFSFLFSEFQESLIYILQFILNKVPLIHYYLIYCPRFFIIQFIILRD